MNESRVDNKRHGDKGAPVELVDCGRASEATRGVPLFLLFEIGWPPFNKMFLI